jgi:hypothetical protein
MCIMCAHNVHPQVFGNPRGAEPLRLRPWHQIQRHQRQDGPNLTMRREDEISPAEVERIAI